MADQEETIVDEVVEQISEGGEFIVEEIAPEFDAQLPEVIKAAQGVIDSLKVEAPNGIVKKKGGRPKKDIPTPGEVQSMTDEEVIKNGDNQTMDLYGEFSSFLEDKAKIKGDTGIKVTLPSSIQLLDTYMGGGFAVGTMSLLVGTPGCGKSTLAAQSLGASQKKFNGNILVGYLDSEEATTMIRLSNLGVRNPKIRPYNDITVEKVFKYIEGLCVFKEAKNIIDIPSVVVWDSVANTISQREREVEDINQAIGFKARLLSLLIPKYIAKLGVYNICLIAVNQLRDLIQMGNFTPAKDMKFMSQGKDIPGGNTLKFNAFHLLEMKMTGVTDPEKHGFDGFITECKFVKNKLFTPNLKFKLVGNFVTGFSNFWTNFIFLVETKRLQTGAWNYLVNYPTKKFRTKELETLYKTDLDFQRAFDESVAEALKTEIVEKYNPELD